MSQITLFNKQLSVKTEEIIDTIKQSVFSGEVDALQTGIFLKKISKISEDIYKDNIFKEYIQKETVKHFTGKSYEGHNMKITCRATKTWYDFSNCNDPYWNALEEIETTIKALKKDREETLKAYIPKNETVQLAIANTSIKIQVDQLPVLNWEPSGEETTINPPIKYQSEGLVYSETKEKE